MKFDWIDFGQSWREPEQDAPPFDNLVHNSTASLFAALLRRRDSPFSKIFCWLRRTENVLEQSDTPGVRHIEATFPYSAYEVASADRLAIFADWLVQAVQRGAPELGIHDDEVDELIGRLAADHYAYNRTDKLKREPGEARCQITYRHTPTDLMITASCKLADGSTVTRTLEKHPFARDELVYGRSITRCIIGEDNRLTIESFKGIL